MKTDSPQSGADFGNMQLISSVLLLLISTILIEAQDDGAPSNKCDPGTFPTEVISQGGQLFLFCHPAPTCAALAQGAGVRTGYGQ